MATVFCLVVVSAGCSGSSDDDIDAAEPAGADVVAPTTTSAESAEAGADDEEAAQLIESVLADGSVTHAEMEKALLSVLSCVERTGFVAELVEFSPGEGNEFAVSASTEDAVDAADAELERCRGLYLTDIEAVYSIEHGPSAEEIEARDRVVVECLVDRGHDVAGLSVQEAAEIAGFEDLIECEA